ncbi:MAG: ABC transporter ATP-binding protein [Ardenticatenaceae bacterium]|nr:ABC transporter ATP-binding protein [Ardenticatenaceae bacterium]
MSSPSPALQVEDLVRQFGALRALDGVSFRIRPGERHAMIGPNGAGKTTLFNCIGGEIVPTSGHVLLHGRDITGLGPHLIASAGLARTFQRNNLFLGLSVFDNVCLATQRRMQITRHLFSSVGRFDAVNVATDGVLERVGLAEQRSVLAKNLSYGEQRQLEIAVALASEPSVLLLDEPSAGMSQAETNRMVELIACLPRDLTIVIIEHDMDVVFALADRITVLHYGSILAEGTPAEVKENPAVQDVYLGAGANVMAGLSGFGVQWHHAVEGEVGDG